MADYVVAQAAVLIVPTLDKFRERLEKELRRIQTQTGPIEVDGTFNSKKLVAGFEATKAYLESRDINVNARINPKQLTEIRHVYEDLSRDFKKKNMNYVHMHMACIKNLVKDHSMVSPKLMY